MVFLHHLEPSQTVPTYLIVRILLALAYVSKILARAKTRGSYLVWKALWSQQPLVMIILLSAKSPLRK
ncbi:hypothetical protein AOQ84DRAFT_60078 [Glonium stellatum]|uniref:Uncharacterized protein n=1 Tax=Glonium stellatum TaxID=574774 RepID=A0A8E2EYQ4_9PEZI|nr:hypothetical protein AOQ84DRAFT_60078 [Glonium stellatum]